MATLALAVFATGAFSKEDVTPTKKNLVRVPMRKLPVEDFLAQRRAAAALKREAKREAKTPFVGGTGAVTVKDWTNAQYYGQVRVREERLRPPSATSRRANTCVFFERGTLSTT